jgi:hypothetical protein
VRWPKELNYFLARQGLQQFIPDSRLSNNRNRPPKTFIMAQPNLPLIDALRETARRLREGAHYSWGHHGACNCGNLLQVVCKLSKEEIVRYAHTGVGEWTEIAEEYCSVSDAPLYLMMQRLEHLGLTPTDIHNIEYLEDREVLNKLPGGFRWLKRNQREDVILYFETMAGLLEEKLIAGINIPRELFRPMEMELV